MSESVTTLFDASVKRFDRRPSMQYFCTKDDMWKIKDWQDLSISVARLANAIISLGLKQGERIAILSLTRPEWVISDIAIMKSSCIVVPIYHSSLDDQIAYILNDADARIIFVENEEQLLKVRHAQLAVGALSRVIIFDTISEDLKDNEFYLEDFIKGHGDICASKLVDRHALATLVYTSGTTGEPKGAMISHDNLLYAAHAIDKLGVLSQDDIQLLFLPLAHIFARVLMFSWLRTGHLLAFAQSIDKIVDNMAVIKPTFMAGVPRIFEKMRAKTIETALSSAGSIKKPLIKFAFDEADRLAKEEATIGIKTYFAKRLVFNLIGKKLQKKFGGRLRFFISGGAQLSSEVFIFFQLCGIALCDGYGLTETTAATCLNLPWSMRQGTVGKPLPGTDVQLNDDGEIIVRGRGVFFGFWNKKKETDEVLEKDGWFHTGDIGRIDSDGFVKIVDRKRDIIVTSQGKNVAPQRVENLIKSKSPVIAHAVVIGDKRPYLCALIALDKKAAQLFLADEEGGLSVPQLSADAKIFQEIKRSINTANQSLAKFEQIKRFEIIDKEFEVGKELTPTLKVKRKECLKKYKKQIDHLYA